MGARGHFVIRCRGRYFVYYNQFDSYPEGLGNAIVHSIPVDPEEFREWLESMKEVYSRLAQEFEEHHLPIESDFGEKNDLKGTSIAESELYSKHFLAIDDRLQGPPLQTMSKGHLNNLFIEFTYTLDLDRGILSVDDAAHFRLSKIPRVSQWIEYLDLDSRYRRALESDTPEDIIGNLEWRPDMENEIRLLPENINVHYVMPKISLGPAAFVPKQELLVYTFQAVRHVYREVLDRFILSWRPDDFSFREMAFALLSLAAGEISYECPKILDSSHRAAGYYLLPDRGQPPQQGFLPTFLGESHLPGMMSGSAPMETIYSFGNVLIYLTSRLDLLDVEEASITKVINAGLDRGLSNFCALAFSILDFVLLQVITEQDGTLRVERSPLMSLFHFDDKSSSYALGPRSRAPFEGSELDLDQVSFVALIRFFNAAGNKSVMSATSSILPNEILAIIMKFSNIQTYHALAKVSSSCREIACTRFRLNEDYAVVGVGQGHKQFTLEDLHSGDRVQSTLSSHGHDVLDIGKYVSDDDMALNPIVGVAGVQRASIVDPVSMIFSGLKPKDPISEKLGRYPKLVRFPFVDNPGVNAILDIPDYLYPTCIEEAWERYLQQILDLKLGGFKIMERVHFPCLLPPGYCRLKAERVHRIELQVFLRHARDDTTEGWARIHEYAIRELANKETTRHDHLVSPDKSLGAIGILAFGAKFKLFYYPWHNPSPPTASPATSNSYSERVAASVTNPDPAMRMIPLSPETRPLDLHKTDERAELELWVGRFRDSHNTVFDPMFDGYVPVRKDPE